MIDRIINGALRNRLLVLVLIAGVAGAGYWAYTEVPTDSYPDVSPTLVQVFTVSPGLSPVDVETQISYPIEIAMYGLSRLERVQSTSIFGLSRVNVYFEDETDIYFARRLVLERLGKAREEIPRRGRFRSGERSHGKTTSTRRTASSPARSTGATPWRCASPGARTRRRWRASCRWSTEAEAEQSPTQRFADRFERYFVPAVLGLVVLLLFAWVPLDETFAESFYRAMAVLVAASPCALAIATPSAVLSGVARAGRGGVLVKGGGPLENLGTLTALAFDKTGTLTEGEPRVTDVRPYNGTMEEELLSTAVAVEELSDHPLAEAVVRFGRERLDARRCVQCVAAAGLSAVSSRAGERDAAAVRFPGEK